MYISPFWCGVAATILAEVVAVIVLVIVNAQKGGKK